MVAEVGSAMLCDGVRFELPNIKENSPASERNIECMVHVLVSGIGVMCFWPYESVFCFADITIMPKHTHGNILNADG